MMDSPGIFQKAVEVFTTVQDTALETMPKNPIYKPKRWSRERIAPSAYALMDFHAAAVADLEDRIHRLEEQVKELKREIINSRRAA